ncbi:MAG: NAD(P)H-quinone oxidoreductase subunit 5 [Bradymonadia bacterium]|jgi:NAD(P)H-quinone oxidoreductase subunit 5
MLITAQELGPFLRFDAFTLAVAMLVALIGAIVIRFSSTYLDGSERRRLFMHRLWAAVFAVQLLVLAGNLLTLCVGWIATGIALDRLLRVYSDRPRVRRGANRARAAARASDVLVLSASALLFTHFGTADISTIATAARVAGDTSLAIELTTLSIAGAAILRCALLPMHSWLLDVVDAPSPLCALLHAGILNAGGILVLRFADVMMLGTGALPLLALVGALSAGIASMVMLTQTSVKSSLAWSSIAQMGFMLFECGIGAFSFAALHLVAHSLYKAHAFLSSGSVVEIERQFCAAQPSTGVRPVIIAAAALAAMIIAFGVPQLIGLSPFDSSGSNAPAIILTAMLGVGLTQLLARAAASNSGPALMAKAIAVAAGCSLAFAAGKALFDIGLTGVLPPNAASLPMLAIGLLTLASFGAIVAVQLARPAVIAEARWASVYVHMKNGLYAAEIVDELARRLSPRRSTQLTTRRNTQGTNS